VEASRVPAASVPVDDLPGAEVFLVRVMAGGVEVEPVSVHLGEEVSPAGEVFDYTL
jgi:hypothetical protein